MDKLIKLNEVTEITGLSKTTIYKLIKAGTFPNQIKVSERSSRWRLSEIQQWVVLGPEKWKQNAEEPVAA